MSFTVDTLFHPSHRVSDLAEARRFFKEVFGRDSIDIGSILADMLADAPPNEGANYPGDYSLYTPIGDVFFGCIDPSRYIVDGVQRYENVTRPQLNGMCWGVRGMREVWRELQRAGIRCTDQKNIAATGEDPPNASFSSDPSYYLFFTVPEDTGIRYEFYSTERITRLDPRQSQMTRPSPSRAVDPLGIERCSHHTVLTRNLDREVALLVTVLGGEVIYEGPNDVLDTDSTFVGLADTIIECAVPRSSQSIGTYGSTGDASTDVYHSLTWKVQDLSRVESHLKNVGVGIGTRTDTMIVMDPADGLGIPWGFSSVDLPNDPRPPL
jgi:catechol 2,3-dioxygenase-like lactoylglutathione lyase family enzyme